MKQSDILLQILNRLKRLEDGGFSLTISSTDPLTITTSPPVAAVGTVTTVAAVATDTTILAANPNRLAFKIFNDSTKELSLLFAVGTASASNRTEKLAAGQVEDYEGYTGIVKGGWFNGTNGAARVTEFTP